MRKLYVIASDIKANWKNISPYAKPYINAMMQLETMRDYYYCDSAHEIVMRFLANASTWRGDKAREIKAELRELIGETK